MLGDQDDRYATAEDYAAHARVLEQAREIMALQADLSTARTEIATLRGYVEQCYRDAEGHNHCWRNVERLFEQFGLKAKRRALPPLAEFKAGCEAFQCAVYTEPERWPDFVDSPAAIAMSDDVDPLLP